ncbi:MAG: hypothetical protein R6X18_14910 [Chloroflexota bacterium]
MKNLMLTLASSIILTLPFAVYAEEPHATDFKVQAYSFSGDPIMPGTNENCAAYLKNLLMSNGGKFNLLATTAVVGPPGIVYTLRDFKGEIAIVKCGLHGGGCGGEDEGGCGGH